MTSSADWLTREPKTIDQTEGRGAEHTGNREPWTAALVLSMIQGEAEGRG
jgi:hypothetical protein